MTETNPIGELKRCPFCDSQAELILGFDHHGGYFTLGCPVEECSGRLAYYTEPIENLSEAIKSWNTRSAEAYGKD